MSESRYDLAGMTNEQLEALRADVVMELNVRSAEEKDSFFEGSEFKALKKEFKALKKEGKSFTKTKDVELTLPLKCKLKLEMCQNLEYVLNSSYDAELYDVFDVQVSAKVQPGNYDKLMQANLQGVVDSACQDLCSEVLFLDREFGELVDGFLGRLNAFRERLQETPASLADLE